MSRVNVLLIGGGGREHALAWKMQQSPRMGELWVTHAENAGLASLGRAVEVPIEPAHPFRMQRFCEQKGIGLVVIGPEDPLAEGLGDSLAGEGRVVFGPSKAAAQLEADKAWAKKLMRSGSIPMADGRVFGDAEAAKAYVRSRESPQVVKASGLAKGKGVIVPSSAEEAVEAIDRIMVKREFGDAGRTIVVEERLEGREVSLLALVDGRSIYVLEPCRDHKRLGDGDTGPNTGGMGVVCPGGVTDDATIEKIQRDILVPTIDTLRREGIEYRGVLFAGIMLTVAGPKVLEFNVRFGDPECQALMARLDADLIEVMLATGQKRLDGVEIGWKAGASCCVVLASRGYPEKVETGFVVEGLEEAGRVEGVTVFHAGTKRDAQGRVVTHGGRVFSVTGVGASVAEASERAYRACELIRYEGKVMRRDIGVGGEG